MSPGQSESLCQTRGGKGPWSQATAGQEEKGLTTSGEGYLGPGEGGVSAAVLMELD